MNNNNDFDKSLNKKVDFIDIQSKYHQTKMYNTVAMV